MASALDKLLYDTAQAARVSWFFGQKLLAGRLTKPMPLPDKLKKQPATLDRRRILADLRKLMEQDWRNIEAGIYARARGLARQPAGRPYCARSIFSPIWARSTPAATAIPASAGCSCRRRPAIRPITASISTSKATAI